MRTIDADALKESLKESRDNCSVWLQDCKEAKSQKWIGRAEQALITFNECLMRIDTIPTIESERRTGKWIREVLGSTSGYGTTVMYQCTNCEKMSISKYKFCPNCGSRMLEEGGEDDE